VRLYRGLPIAELYARGLRWCGRHNYPAEYVRTAITPHTAPNVSLRVLCKRRLLREFIQSTLEAFENIDTSIAELLARCRPAVSDFALYHLAGAMGLR